MKQQRRCESIGATPGKPQRSAARANSAGASPQRNASLASTAGASPSASACKPTPFERRGAPQRNATPCPTSTAQSPDDVVTNCNRGPSKCNQRCQSHCGASRASLAATAPNGAARRGQQRVQVHPAGSPRAARRRRILAAILAALPGRAGCAIPAATATAAAATATPASDESSVRALWRNQSRQICPWLPSGNGAWLAARMARKRKIALSNFP